MDRRSFRSWTDCASHPPGAPAPARVCALVGRRWFCSIAVALLCAALWPSVVSAQSRPALGLIAGGRSFVDEDLQRTYGTVPELGLRLLLPFEPRTHFFLGVGYVFDDGDPYYGDPHFDGDGAARLRLLPLEFGVRTNTLAHSTHRFHLGAAIQYTRASERIRGGAGGSMAGMPSYSGWGWGGRILAGPEWRLGSAGLAAGAEVSLGIGTVYGRHQHREREIALFGMRLRAYLTRDF
ncbi:MAG: hypothetical protein GF330_07975 [Candidatus Eisenbacteria bacterium]|nr:hypothetical protein [Candidatus Eisenbacteria bacterium]